MEAVYQAIIRELEMEAMELRRKLEEKKRKVMLLQRMTET